MVIAKLAVSAAAAGIAAAGLSLATASPAAAAGTGRSFSLAGNPATAGRSVRGPRSPRARSPSASAIRGGRWGSAGCTARRQRPNPVSRG